MIPKTIISLKKQNDELIIKENSSNSKLFSNRLNKKNISSEPSFRQTVNSTYSMYNNNISSKINNTYQNINNSTNTINSTNKMNSKNTMNTKNTMNSKNTMNTKNTIDSFENKILNNNINIVINSNDSKKTCIKKKDDIFNDIKQVSNSIQDKNFQNIIINEKEKIKLGKKCMITLIKVLIH